jgi:hypothetical protein
MAHNFKLNSGSNLKSLAWAARARRLQAALGPADLGAAEADGAIQSLIVTGTDAAAAQAAARWLLNLTAAPRLKLRPGIGQQAPEG